MVPFPEPLHGCLARCVNRTGRVYGFGASEAALSQYLAEADFTWVRFHPDAFTMVIVGNDFDESLLAYKKDSGFHYFREGSTGLVLRRVGHSPASFDSSCANWLCCDALR